MVSAEVDENAVLRIVVDDPFKSAGVGVALVQRGFAAIKTIQIGDEPLQSGMFAICEQAPIDLTIVVPFPDLTELPAHEEQFLARMRPHEREVRAECRKLVPI